MDECNVSGIIHTVTCNAMTFSAYGNSTMSYSAGMDASVPTSSQELAIPNDVSLAQSYQHHTMYSL